jgi:hypothetical protein
MGAHGPRVVIAAPLYNGRAHLAGAVGSLLAQSFPDFRLVLVDDASGDGSWEVARELAAADPRVRLHRNERRLGMLGNTRRAWALARQECPGAELVALASDHDVWHPEWLAALVAALDAHPAAILAYPLTERIDAEGLPVPGVRTWRCDTAGERDALRRLARAHRCMVAGDMIYGLMRADALARVGPYRAVLVPDRLLLSELALEGEFVQIPRVLWQRRFTGLADLERQRRAFWPGGAPLHARVVPWWVAHAAVAGWERAVLGRHGSRRAGARVALGLLAAGARLRALRRVQHARRRLGARLERPAAAAMRRSPALRGAVARRSLPLPADTQEVLARLLDQDPAHSR